MPGPIHLHQGTMMANEHTVRRKARPQQPQLCEACGKEFFRTCGEQRHCSVSCRFWSKVDKRGPDECWPWMMSQHGQGYGQFWFDGRMRPAHRIAVALSGEPLPDDVMGCHSCDNPPCCNPRHIFPGNHAINAADKVAKGRQARGERIHRSHLTEDDIRAIRASPETQRKLGAKYGVDHTIIYDIKARNIWKHVA